MIKGITIGIIALFIVSVVSPIVIGSNAICWGDNAFYSCFEDDSLDYNYGKEQLHNTTSDSTDEVEISYYDPDTLNKVIGLSDFTPPVYWDSAVRFTPDELDPYPGWNLTKVVVYLSCDNGQSEVYANLTIYGEGTPTEPGDLIYQDTGLYFNATDWYTIELTESIPLDDHDEIWVAITWKQTKVPAFIPYADEGPAVDGKGDWVRIGDGDWSELQTYGHDYNWGMGGIIDVDGNTLYVGGDGPGNYTKIQDAIDDASVGDTVFVYSGTYNESVNIDKLIKVIGEDKNTTIIDGPKEVHKVVKLKAEGITFSGFSVTHGRDWANDAGIYIPSSYNVVEDNIITETYGGEGGILVDGDHNEIINNIIRNNKGEQGILIGWKNDYNIVSGNTIYQNSLGIRLHATKNNIVVNNNISHNGQQGIWITIGENNEVIDNIIANNRGVSIKIEGDASKVLVYGNIFKNNNKGLVIEDAVSVTVAMNSFYVKGIQLNGKKLNYWKSHNIHDNTINGKPINFYKSEEDLVVPFDTGQLILADCSNCIVKNLNISNVDYGIQIGFSNGNNIFSNELYDNVGNCIRIFDSSNNVIDDNLIKNNLGTGIVISGSSQNNEITKNNITNNDDGINIGSKSSLNIIRNNNIEENRKRGVYLVGSENEIHRNNFKQNNMGITLDFSHDNSISENNFIKNTFPGYFIVDYKKIHENKWNKNYYGFSLRFFPKLIWGLVKTKYYWEPIPGEKEYFYRPGLNFDWHPAREPFYIGV